MKYRPLRAYLALVLLVFGIIFLLDVIYSFTRQSPSLGIAPETYWEHLNAEIDSAAEQRGQWIDLDDLAWPAEHIEKLKQQKFLILYNEQQHAVFHGFHAESNRVYVVPVSLQSTMESHRIWALLFYGAIAVSLFLWFRPVLRDVEKLKYQALTFANDKHVIPDTLSKSSTLKPVAIALNKMSRKIQQLMNLQKDIATYVSHDIRTPLARIKFTIESLEDRKTYKAIAEEVHEIESLISELLQYSQFEYERPNLKLAHIGLYHFVQPIVEKFSDMSGLQIHNEVPQDIIVTVDPTLFKRIIDNLLGNSLRFANELIKVRYTNNRGQHCLIIEDDGPGFVLEQLNNLTKPFVRNESKSTSENYGLGLAIVETICHWHHGQLQLSNSKDLGGAQFIVRWNITNE